jgi:hypothetical protein
LLIARIFAVRKKVAKAIHIFIAALLVTYLSIEIPKVILCIPIQAWWNPSIKNARCLNLQALFISDTCVAIVTDFIILLVPVALIWSMQMPLKRKIRVGAMLSAGGAATGVTIYRLEQVIISAEPLVISALT